MALPKNTQVFEETLDPYDILDFEVNLAPLLQDGEAIDSFTVTVPPESALLGLQVLTTGGYSTTVVGNVLKLWLSIEDEEQDNSVFVAGITLPIQISMTTTSVPPRRKQRTVAVEVIQR